MKKKIKLGQIIVVSLSAVSLFYGSAFAGTQTECAVKRAEVERQITHAQKYNNEHRAAGLRQALLDIDRHCTDRELQELHREKVAEKQRKEAERERELSRAQENGTRNQVMQKQKKLMQARETLEQTQQ